ncbi:hypothetical protein [Nonomuraea rhizosphaerae]|uniref:hypothetical protein n=1 Tax=Nonomuraea rhizosphaerae TaxID=2665663 RepID=UPI001C602735|nr:hypothetical protein [Nonomuraea rhizosphaerae]
MEVLLAFVSELAKSIARKAESRLSKVAAGAARNCPRCGNERVRRWAPVHLRVLNMTGMLAFGFGIVLAVVGVLLFLVLVAAKIMGGVAADGWHLAGLLAANLAFVALMAAMALAGVVVAAPYRACPPRKCWVCRDSWPRPGGTGPGQ